jgi:protein-disulfide isomerase
MFVESPSPRRDSAFDAWEMADALALSAHHQAMRDLMNRRLVLSAGAAILLQLRDVRSQDAWYSISGDDGRPVENLRLPVEIAGEADTLPGVIRRGAAHPDITLFEFFDYNCPYCRAAAGDIDAMIKAQPDVQLVLINNPILSRSSHEAASTQLAVVLAHGEQIAVEFHSRLFDIKGKVDGAKALAGAGEMGLNTTDLAAIAQSIRITEVLKRQMHLASSMGFTATPSFLVAGAGILGYPGPKAMTRIVAAVRECGAIVC